MGAGVRILIVFFLCSFAGNAQALENRLKQHASPYLALHGKDPVAWQEWNADTVARAKRENKLLFVSVGYYACHWCHVMQRESYRNRAIAAQLNRDFIPVKVDRELNVALDGALQTFSSRLLKTAGWPLNAFVTPDGYPVYVVLYASPQDFGKVLNQLAGRWKTDSEGVNRLARQAAQADSEKLLIKPVDAAAVSRWEAAFLKSAQAEMDEFRGGFGEVGKFPMSPQLALMLEIQARTPDAGRAEFLRLTLDQMATKGLRDQVHGGFFRYTTDPDWETPHFEKMLYDNAQLALIYLRASEILQEPRYRQIGLSTVDFMLHTLATADGGFYTSVSAVDAQGREGTYYLWTRQQLKQQLSAAEFAVARRVWKLDAPQPFDFGYLPAAWMTPTPHEQALLQSAYRKLRQSRIRNGLPRDIKINAGLNGLALSALSAAMRVDPAYKAPAERAQGFLQLRLMGGGELFKAVSGNKQVAGAELEDYAYVAQGMLDYAKVTGDRAARQTSLQLARKAWSLFATEQGWKSEPRPLLATMLPAAVIADGAVVSPSAVLIGVSMALNDVHLRTRALAAAQWHSPLMARDPFSYPGQIKILRRALVE